MIIILHLKPSKNGEMSIFKNILKSLADKAKTDGVQWVKDSFDPNSEMNQKSLLGHKARLRKEKNYAEILEAQLRTKTAKSRLDNFESLNGDLLALERREREIDLELKRLPITEIESKTKLYEELAKNKESYNKLLLVKKQLEGLQG